MTLLDCLSEVKDPRRLQGQRYSSVALLLIIIMGILRAKYGYREIGRFCEHNEPVLVKKLGFKNNKAPSHVSIRSFILAADFASIQHAFHKWARRYVPIEEGEWISVDGKSIRSTVSDAHDQYQSFVSLVSLFSSKREQVLHVEKLENKKASEAKTVEDLLEVLDLRGAILTLDALHCKKTLGKIVASGNHYLVKVKGNQSRLKAALEETVARSSPIGYHREEATSRGRLEVRETYLYDREGGLDQGWESIATIAFVHRHVLSKSREHQTQSIYITDVRSTDARYIAQGIRSHWHIENKLHHVKDVVMWEDKACTKNKSAAANLALFRDFAFNILKAQNKSIKYASELFANYNVKELLSILSRT